MGNLKDTAMEAVRDYVVELLQNKDWCSAKSAGRALESLAEIYDHREDCKEEVQSEQTTGLGR